MELSSSISINLISALIWLIIGAIFARIFHLLKNRQSTAFSRLSGITRKAKSIHLIYGLIDRHRNGTHYSVDEGDVCALCLALSFLEKKYSPERVYAINSQAARTNLGNYTDVVSISGPIWNDISAHYLNAIELPVEFTEKKNRDGALIDTLTIKYQDETKIFETSYTNGVPRECFGIVVAGPIRTGRSDQLDQNVVIAAGISALGTYGAVCWLKNISESNTSVLQKMFNDTPKLKVAVIAIKDNSPKGFRAYASDNSNPSFLSSEVIYEIAY